MIDWRHWHNEPILIGGLVLLGWLWAVLAGPLRPWLVRKAGIPPALAPFPRAAGWRFYGALVVFYLAVGSPLDQIGEGYLLSVHMLQHQLLVYPAAMLFLLGLPSWMVDALVMSPGLRRFASVVTRPMACGLVFVVVFGAWHMPWLYDAALRNKSVHVAEHLAFFGAALMYWWPVLSPSRVLPRLGYGSQMLYLLGVVIGMTPTHAYIIFSGEPLYPTYEYAPRLIANFSAQDDQLLAGVSMQLTAMLVSIGGVGVAFYRWYRAAEQADGTATEGALLARHG